MTVLIFLIATIWAMSPSFAQDEAPAFDKTKVPATALKVDGFVPAGWMLEEDIKGDLNKDGVSDHVLKLIQKMPADANKDEGNMGERAMVIVFADKGGKLRNVATTDKVLQCGGCGGAFYGMLGAPANVSIKKGVIVVTQDYGSRSVNTMTLRFRHKEQPGTFILIGSDFSSRDRADGSVASESTNYLTGKRITTTGKGKKTAAKTSKVVGAPPSITEVDRDKFDEDVTKRLGLD